MKDIVFVSGHKNPDSDSICSAIAYADFLFKIGRYNAVPVRLGEINKETEYILKRFHLEIPVLLKTVKQKVEDLDYDKVTVFSKELTLKTAWSLMKQQNLKSAPVSDDHNQLLGLLSTSNIIEGYMDEWDSQILKAANTPIENVIDTLDASILYLDKQLKTIKGEVHIAAMTGEEAMKRVNENDVVIVGGDRDEAVEHLIKAKVSLIILTGSLAISKKLLDKCEAEHISVISTPFNTFMASQQIIQAIPVEYVMQKGGLMTFSTDDTVDYVKEVMSETRFRSYPVLDFMGRVVGSISRFQVLNGMKKKVVQVDHNERSQAIDGIEEAEILEIVDHHRVADIQTIGPVLFRSEPVGCTATIVAKCYKEHGLEIPSDMAGIMLGAIISDTLLFKSPTCTPTDTKIARELAQIAGVDIQEFGMEMFKAGTSLAGKTVEEIFNQDYKKFTFGDLSAGVAQVNTMDIEGFAPYKAEMLAYMDQVARENHMEFTMLLLTDVINATSEVFVAGPRPDYVANAFKVELVDQQASLPGVISRKKQVVPVITEALTQ
ncbi:MAG: putative manganese-dependent inorganic diphosphatase [Coprobacillus cateniformis]|uniref:inorganic diphosphatase n=1 Tax=Longibaculum muris TaxID=1796628 RepID=A0A4R3Z8Y6_9FIRM|nr:putative manganese-dependent inorganic diphosphatase [Longibaculum muris]KXU47015.1 DHHA2 domain protein [Candidatus Stoquefichus sp. KLE1796]MBS5113717.1 putative manganese-dependent inorganic diphosphatase [Coprobacillus cateniformis]MCR1888359.1 putative manganese-dependent inorganic diphosphatase [Longibaculum muris]MED9812792.1 putative manganese-dependent inorganic diphosphatase [Longibaculum muris]TCW00583.1 manganese-dependent inorganic pyrophosphatase [Longibaculum muris]